MQKVVILLKEYQVALHLQHTGSLGIMVIRVVKFSSGGYKIRKIFAQESTYPKGFIGFWALVMWGGVNKCKIWLSKSIFYVKNHPNLSQCFSLKNSNLGANFLLLTFFDITSIFNLYYWNDAQFLTARH